MPKMQATVMFEFASEITPEVVATVLDVETETAQELCAGMVAFNRDELELIAEYKGIGLTRLVREKR